MTDDSFGAIEQAVGQVALAVEDGGALLSVDRVIDSTVHVQLVLDPTDCDEDCIVPTPDIIRMVESAVERATGAPYAVKVSVSTPAGADD
jgi:hypothetical protein